MTDIESMVAGPEMDALVAERVMGMERGALCDNGGEGLKDVECGYEERWLCPTCGWTGIVYGNPHTRATPKFSTDTAAAWEIIDMPERWSWELRIGRPNPLTDGHSCPHADCGVTLYLNKTDSVTAHGDELPIAICRAALKAVGDKS